MPPIELSPQIHHMLAASDTTSILRYVFEWLTDLDDRVTAQADQIAALDNQASALADQVAKTDVATIEALKACTDAFNAWAPVLQNLSSRMGKAEWAIHEVDASREALVIRLIQALVTPGPATSLQIKIQPKGDTQTMSTTTLSVDVTGEEVSASWVDDKGEPTTDIPAGATIAFASSDSTIASVGASVASATGATAPLSFLLAGSADISATATDATGAALPGFTVGTTSLVITPGPAASLLVAVDAAPPVAVPAPVVP